MQQFTYSIRDELGIPARSAGLLAKLAQSYDDTVITVTKGDKTAIASQLIKIMGLGVKQGNEIIVVAEGPAEAESIAAVQKFFEENL